MKISKLSSALTLTVLAAGLAQGSHFRGAAMIPSVDANGLLTLQSTSFWRPTAVANIAEGGAPLVSGGVGSMTRIVGPTNNTSDIRFTEVTETHTVQLPGAGTYSISASSCCRVGGILNAAESTWTMNSTIFWDGVNATTPIQFNFGAVQPEVPRGFAYNGNLGATAGPGLTLTYDQVLNQNINSQPPGFSVDPNTGALFISAANTATYGDNPTGNIGADYAFSGNITAKNASGKTVATVEFDWLFDATNSTGPGNKAPQVTDAVLNIILGQTVTHTFLGSDPDGDPLTWTFLSLLGPGAGLSSTFDPLTQLFTWNSTGSLLGTYIAQVRASDGKLTDVGQLTINVTSGGGGPVVPEPSTFAFMGAGLIGLAYWRRRRA